MTTFDLVAAGDFVDTDATPKKASGRTSVPSSLIPAVKASLTSQKGKRTPTSLLLDSGTEGQASPFDATRREITKAARQIGLSDFQDPNAIRVEIRKVMDPDDTARAFLWFRAYRRAENPENGTANGAGEKGATTKRNGK